MLLPKKACLAGPLRRIKASRRGYFSPPVVIILALITLAVAAVIYFNRGLILKSKNQQAQPVLTSPSPTSSPDLSSGTSVKEDETANWKTYTDNGFKFEIKYPNNMKTTKLTAHDDLLGGVSLNLIYNDQEFRPQASEIYVWVEDSKSLNLEEWLKVKSTTEPWGSPIDKKEFYGYKNLGSVVLDGVQGIKFLDEPMGYTSSKVAVKNGNLIYLVGYVNVKEDLSPVYNQILSTFQFLN